MKKQNLNLDIFQDIVETSKIIYSFNSKDQLKDILDSNECVYMILKKGTLESAIIADEWDLSLDSVYYVGHEDNLRNAVVSRTTPIRFKDDGVHLRPLDSALKEYKYFFKYHEFEIVIFKPKTGNSFESRKITKSSIKQELGFVPIGNDNER